MRKSPTIQPRICENCGETYTPKGTAQRFCDICRPIKANEVKQRYYKKMNPNAKPKTRCTDVCCVCGGPFSSRFDGKPYCNMHYLRMKVNGTPDYVGRKTKNTFEVSGDTVTAKTSKGQEFLISLCDLEQAKKYTWCISKTGYLVANINHKVVKLQRYLLSPPEDMVVDHINGNPLDNRRCNLRICSQTDNSKNTKQKSKATPTPGIQIKPNGRYRVRITVDRKEIAVGTFDTMDEAIAARHAAERKYYGEFSPIDSRQTSTPGDEE